MEKELKDCGNILAEGELTGHAHRVGVEVLERADTGVRVFEGATTITHEEHKPITLPQKLWASDRVVERDFLTEMVNKVRD